MEFLTRIARLGPAVVGPVLQSMVAGGVFIVLVHGIFHIGQPFLPALAAAAASISQASWPLVLAYATAIGTGAYGLSAICGGWLEKWGLTPTHLLFDLPRSPFARAFSEKLEPLSTGRRAALAEQVSTRLGRPVLPSNELVRFAEVIAESSQAGAQRMVGYRFFAGIAYRLMSITILCGVLKIAMTLTLFAVIAPELLSLDLSSITDAQAHEAWRVLTEFLSVLFLFIAGPFLAAGPYVWLEYHRVDEALMQCELELTGKHRRQPRSPASGKAGKI